MRSLSQRPVAAKELADQLFGGDIPRACEAWGAFLAARMLSPSGNPVRVIPVIRAVLEKMLRRGNALRSTVRPLEDALTITLHLLPDEA